MSTLSITLHRRLRMIPTILERISPSLSGSWNNPQGRVPGIGGSSSSSCCRTQRNKSSLSGFPLPAAIQESVKTSILDKVTRDDSKVWSSGYTPTTGLNGTTNGNQYYTGNNGTKGSVNEEISAWHHDPLDDLLLDKEIPHYWPNLPSQVRVDADPFQLSENDVSSLSKSIREDLLGTDHPVLNQAASYFFGSADGGKKVRPLMVMLLSRALSDTIASGGGGGGGGGGSQPPATAIVVDENSNDGTLFSSPLPWQRQDLPQAQRRLAEISEMIHTASLFHDDVIDGSETRRGVASVHMVFGNKMAILAGDYLLARASISLARLRHVEVVECMSTIIEHLVRGEVMQMRGTSSSEGNKNERMIYYLKKNYYKTGSLMANSCKSAALLADCPPELVAASYKYGKHVGMAFQLVDDVLDFEGDVKSMGKPALADLREGLSTAPVLFAAEEFPQLEAMMDRKFKHDGDVEQAREWVFQSQGIERTKELARVHAERAMEAVLPWTSSVHRDALINLAYKVVQRTK